MSGKKRLPEHRAIIYGGVIGGLTREQVNTLLASAGGRELVERSHDSIRRHYVPYFKEDFDRLGRAIFSPPTYSDLSDAGVGAPNDTDDEEP